MRSLKRKIVNWILRTELFAFYILYRHSFLNELGWFESWKSGRPVDRSGQPIPWITYPAFLFLQSKISKQWSVFEYGSGNSSLWWSNQVSKVVSCEHDVKWHEEIRGMVGKNVELHLKPLSDPQSYVDMAINTGATYDVMFIDGAERESCLMKAPVALKPNGIIVLDDSDRPAYIPAIQHLLSLGFKAVDFDGPGPVIAIRWRTSIYYRSDNCLGL